MSEWAQQGARASERLTGKTRSCSRYSPTSVSVIGAVGDTICSTGSSFWLFELSSGRAAAAGSGALISSLPSRSCPRKKRVGTATPRHHETAKNREWTFHPVISMDLPQPGRPRLEGFRGLVSAFKYEPTPHQTPGTAPDPAATPPLVAVSPQYPTPSRSPSRKRKRSASPGLSPPTTAAKRGKATLDKSNSKDPSLFAHLKPLQHRLKPDLDGIHSSRSPTQPVTPR
jgi:hypothetical protein